MTAELEEARQDTYDALVELGTRVTVQTFTGGTNQPDGSRTGEVRTDHEDVVCSDLLDESKRYAAQDTSQRATGTFYLPQKDLGFTPTIGTRVIYDARTFQALSVFPMRLQGGAVAFRLDVAEIGNG